MWIHVKKESGNMKQNITIEDLMTLSEGQKRSLRSLWLPQKYDQAAAFVCMNVETDELDQIEFVVGDILVEEVNGGKKVEVRKNAKIHDNFNVTLRSLRLVNEELEENSEENLEEKEESFEDDDFDYEYMRQEDFFKLEYCLPLLSIGQMINILEESGYKSHDYHINFNSDTNKYSLARPESDFLDSADEYEELCDVLWNKLKDTLE
jgi:hypothetical protein